MNIVRDKMTKEPKGVAFLWYRNRSQVQPPLLARYT